MTNMAMEEEATEEEKDIETLYLDDESGTEETDNLLINKKSKCDDKIPLMCDGEGESKKIKVYKRRWFMLFIFSLNTSLNGCLFMSISAINDIVRKYYSVPPVGIEWLSNMCVLTYVALALPASALIMNWGIRPVIFAAASFNFLGTAFHYAGYDNHRFHFVLLGQAFVAVAYSCILQMPGKLSSLWFPENERATATSIGVVMNLFGVAVGFVQPSLMVLESNNDDFIERHLQHFYLTQLCVGAVVLLITFAYQEKPPTPPTSVPERDSLAFIDSLKLLFQNKYFIFLSQSYGIYFGCFVAIFVLVNPLITQIYPHGVEMEIGWMGFWNNMVAIVSFIFLGILLDRYHKYQLTAFILNVTSLITWLAWVVVLTNASSFTAVYMIYVFLGLFFVPYFACGIEQAAEMTYPVSEETSSSAMLVLGNIYAFIFIVALGVLAQNGYVQLVGYLIVLMYFVSTVLSCLAKTELKRRISEKGP